MDLINELAKNGLLGVLLAMSILANIYLFKKYIEQLEMRRADAVAYRDSLKEPMTNLQRTLDAIVTILQQAGKK